MVALFGAVTGFHLVLSWFRLFPALAGCWAVCLAVAAILPRLAQIPADGRVAQTIAQYSCGLYLSHTFVIGVVFVEMRGWPVAVRATAFVALLGRLSWAAFRLIGKLGIECGRMLGLARGALGPDVAKVPAHEPCIPPILVPIASSRGGQRDSFNFYLVTDSLCCQRSDTSVVRVVVGVDERAAYADQIALDFIKKAFADGHRSPAFVKTPGFGSDILKIISLQVPNAPAAIVCVCGLLAVAEDRPVGSRGQRSTPVNEAPADSESRCRCLGRPDGLPVCRDAGCLT